MTSDNNIQHKPRPLGPHVPTLPAAVASHKCVEDARKDLDRLLDKGDDKKKKKRNDDGNGANVAAEADALKASKKYYEDNAYSKVKIAEQNKGIYEIFKSLVLARTGIQTTRSLGSLMQKLGTLYSQLKDANGEVLNNHCGDDPNKTFNRFNGVALTTKSGKTMEDDGQHALAQAYAQATQTAIAPDRLSAIAQFSLNPVCQIWKECGIANPDKNGRFLKISGNIPCPIEEPPANATNASGGGRRGRSGAKKVRLNDINDEDARIGRQTALSHQQALQKRAMQIKEEELDIKKQTHAFTLMNSLSDGEDKTAIRTELVKSSLMLLRNNRAPPQGANAPPRVIVLDEEDDEEEQT
ncbi:unnamed protein product [Bathycoccus prasinos]